MMTWKGRSLVSTIPIINKIINKSIGLPIDFASQMKIKNVIYIHVNDLIPKGTLYNTIKSLYDKISNNITVSQPLLNIFCFFFYINLIKKLLYY